MKRQTDLYRNKQKNKTKLSIFKQICQIFRLLLIIKEADPMTASSTYPDHLAFHGRLHDFKVSAWCAERSLGSSSQDWLQIGLPREIEFRPTTTG